MPGAVDGGTDGLVADAIVRREIAQALEPGAIGDHGPMARIDLRLLLRRAHEGDRDGPTAKEEATLFFGPYPLGSLGGQPLIAAVRSLVTCRAA